MIFHLSSILETSTAFVFSSVQQNVGIADLKRENCSDTTHDQYSDLWLFVWTLFLRSIIDG